MAWLNIYMIVDLLVSSTNTIYFDLLIILYNYNIITSIPYLIGKSGHYHNENYFISLIYLIVHMYLLT